MKTKILTSLKQEYAHLGLDETFLSGLADMLATSGLVTDENLNAIIAGQKTYLEGIQKTYDKRVNDAVSKTQRKADEAAQAAKAETDKAIASLQKQLADLQEKPKPTEPAPKPDTTTIPDWYKAEKAEREKQLATLQDTINALQSAKTESDTKLKAIEPDPDLTQT